MASAWIQQMKAADLTPEALQKQGTILVDFWASWCGPCRMVAPILDQIAEECQGKLRVGKLNIDDESEAAIQYSVMSIPTMILFQDGKEVERIVGARNKAALMELLSPHLG